MEMTELEVNKCLLETQINRLKYNLEIVKKIKAAGEGLIQEGIFQEEDKSYLLISMLFQSPVGKWLKTQEYNALKRVAVEKVGLMLGLEEKVINALYNDVLDFRGIGVFTRGGESGRSRW